MSRERDNRKRLCKHFNCTRAAFTETAEGISVNLRHGSEPHREVYTIDEMIVYLASRGYVVVEAAKLLKVA